MGIAWSLAWAAVFVTVGLVIGIVDPDSIDAGEGPLQVGAIGAAVGFITGAGFGVILAFAERHKTIRDLSVWRSALWGMIAPAAWALLTPVADSMVIILCPIGAALAAGVVAMAKRGERSTPPDRQRLVN